MQFSTFVCSDPPPTPAVRYKCSYDMLSQKLIWNSRHGIYVHLYDLRYDEQTTSILTEWFLSHKRWPYPAAKEKDALAEATKLTTLQM